jgi:hypothetical protein
MMCWALHVYAQAALLLNRGATNLSITLDFSDVGISGSPATIRDVWARCSVSIWPIGFSFSLKFYGNHRIFGTFYALVLVLSYGKFSG